MGSDVIRATRREFIEFAGRAAAGLTLTALLPGCESFTIDGTLADAEVPFLTPPADWYWFSYAGFEPRFSPKIPAADWSLDVRSGARSVGTVAYRKLRALEDDGFAINYIKTMRCVLGAYADTIPGTRTATGVFRGIPLAKVLEDVSIPGETAKLRLEAHDGFTTSIPYARIFDESQLPVMLAFELNGRPIPPERGGPVRLIVPEMWAFKSMKWIIAIDATTDDASFGVFETQGALPELADTPGLMALTTLSQSPAGLAVSLPGPSIQMHGMALVGGARIDAVEVIVDGGEPQFATITPLDAVIDSLGNDALLLRSSAQFEGDWPYPSVWAPWTHTVELGPGPHTIVLRSIDSNGGFNPSFTADPAIVAKEILIELEVT